MTPPVRVTARCMDGREIEMMISLSSLVQAAKAQVAGELGGLSAGRIRLINGTSVLKNNFASLADAGVQEGTALTVIILPPVYGLVERWGIDAPDELVAKKSELHDALAAAARFRCQAVA